MYIDAHTHLENFNENIDKAIYDINKYKIFTLANSMDIESYKLNQEYSKKSKYIIPTFGIHPWKAKENEKDLDKIIPYIEESKIIGEIGLDFIWIEDKSTYETQRKVFKYILKKAVEKNKWVILHTKGAEEEIYQLLKKYNYNKAIVHWYSGDLKVLEKYIELGCYFTISVDIGISKVTEEVLNKIPLNKLLTETDGPTALEWVNGEYGYPREIIKVLDKIAEQKNIDSSILKKNIKENMERILGKTI